ncbi:carbohydrate kinase family protein [Microvirga alba]|uniref:Carbohydrate kinase n=1 Tax=Microvirga alba TaxID=2791025 RepID=A0A931BSR5_9HYPH|nr:carbohydrate kinase [Microvirga alba]MBF9235318.1 carbohydrate kinase [Microvirga alba]
MILCCGEALIDMLPRGIGSNGTAFLPVAGGAVFNTAIALGRLGERAAFLSGISSDLFGEILMETLVASRVDASLCVRSPFPTTLAFVQFANGDASYTFYDENTAGRRLSEADLPKLPDEVAAIHFGAISLIPEPCGSAYESVMRRAQAHCVVSLDPNIRPGFINDEIAYRERLRRMIGMSDIIKVSEEDFLWLEGDVAFEMVARRWIDGGAAVVILTRGAEGATAITRDHRLFAKSEAITVVDTIGAGDTFNAGFLAGLRERGRLTKDQIHNLSQDDLHHALALGNGVAAITVSRAGANPPWRHEIMAACVPL